MPVLNFPHRTCHRRHRLRQGQTYAQYWCCCGFKHRKFHLIVSSVTAAHVLPANSSLRYPVSLVLSQGKDHIQFSYSFIVTLAWILGKPLSLLFDPYESIALFLTGMTLSPINDSWC
jgi:hypothetical protein